MLLPVSSFVLGAGLVLSVADRVPTLNVEPSCRAAITSGVIEGPAEPTFDQCMDQEKSARAELEKQWSQFSAASRERCVSTTEIGGEPSYVDVLECLIMAKEAADMDKAQQGQKKQ